MKQIIIPVTVFLKGTERALNRTCLLVGLCCVSVLLPQGWTNPCLKVGRVRTLAPNMCGFTVRNFLDATLLAHRILSWLHDSWKICLPLSYSSQRYTQVARFVGQREVYTRESFCFMFLNDFSDLPCSGLKGCGPSCEVSGTWYQNGYKVIKFDPGWLSQWNQWLRVGQPGRRYNSRCEHEAPLSYYVVMPVSIFECTSVFCVCHSEVTNIVPKLRNFGPNLTMFCFSGHVFL